MSPDVNLPGPVPPRILRTENFATDAAEVILTLAREAIAARGLCRLALSGGNTPRKVHQEMVRLGEGLQWSRVQITFGDERCVPPDDEASNYRMARESLLEAVPIPEGNVFRMRGEINPEEAAAEYEGRLAAVAARFGEERYIHDIILLGLGEDGHTASLFPDSLALGERDRNIVPATGPKPPPQRLTFTFPLINAARTVCFLVNDRSKEPVIADVLAGREDYPASRVSPSGGVQWVVGA